MEFCKLKNIHFWLDEFLELRDIHFWLDEVLELRNIHFWLDDESTIGRQRGWSIEGNLPHRAETVWGMYIVM